MSLSFFRFPGKAARLWVLGQMGAARFAFRRMPDVGFWKLCGSGTGEGFTPIPNTQVWAILATWPDNDTARKAISSERVYRRWRSKSAESWTVFLECNSARGAWSGIEPFEPREGHDDGPLAVLTRATLKASSLARFWSRVPRIEDAIGADPNVLFKIGIGEVPWLHQVTFSLWPDTASMSAFARKDGPHARAVRAVREGGWFREELYARFRVTGEAGSWGGSSPLARYERIAA